MAEGEKDADSLTRIGIMSTCNAGGAGKWTAEHAEFLRGRKAEVLDALAREAEAERRTEPHGLAQNSKNAKMHF